MTVIPEQLHRLFGSAGWRTYTSPSGIHILLTPEIAEDLAQILACLNRAVPEVVPRETEN